MVRRRTALRVGNQIRGGRRSHLLHDRRNAALGVVHSENRPAGEKGRIQFARSVVRLTASHEKDCRCINLNRQGIEIVDSRRVLGNPILDAKVSRDREYARGRIAGSLVARSNKMQANPLVTGW